MASLHLFFGYILTQYWVLAEYDLRCSQNDSISTMQEFSKYVKECQVFLHDVLKRLPLHVNADYIGCFEYSGKSLEVYSALNSTKMSIEKCIQNCQNSYFSYAAIQNGSQCLCAIVETDFMQIKESRCSTKCPTDFRLYCGGESAVQLYNTKPVKKDCNRRIIEGNFVGCLADDKLPLLSGNISQSSNMMIKTCLQICEKSRNLYAALKKTNVCLCGNDTIKINASSNVHCQLRCVGNLSQCCGGIQHLQLYRTSIPFPTRLPQWHRKASYLGCFSKKKKDHLLLVMKLFSAMTLELCLSTCEQFGIRYSGVQGEECLCGASAPENGQVADFNCDRICTGNKSQFCGGLGLHSAIFLQVYEIEDVLPFKSTEGMFLGCFIGKVEDLQQMNKITHDKDLSIDICLNSCQVKGLKFAAIEKGSQCACGQLYDNLRKTSNYECNQSCPGNPIQTCGGNKRVQIHGIKLFPKQFTPYGIYLGCFESIPYQMNRNPFRSSSMTLNICIEHCWKKGFPYAALNRGNTCFCGQTSSYGDLKMLDSRCNMQCSSDDGNFCGGIQTFQIYHVEYLLRKFFGPSISIATDLTWP